jgi:hypothetical protein
VDTGHWTLDTGYWILDTWDRVGFLAVEDEQWHIGGDGRGSSLDKYS